MKALFKYLKYWYWFVVSIALCLIIALTVLFITTPVYQVSTTILLQDDKKGDGVLKETAFSDLNMFKTTKSIDNEMQVLRSVNLVEKVLNDLSINTHCYLTSGFLKKEVYGATAPIHVVVNKVNAGGYAQKLNINVINASTFEMSTSKDSLYHTYLFGQQINRAGFSVKVEKGPAFASHLKDISVSFINVNAMARGFRDIGLDITPVIKDANTLTLSLYDNVPQRGVDILNKLVEEYNAQSIAYKNQMALATIQFIDTRLKYLTGDLTSVEQNVEQYKQNNRVTNIASDAQSNLQKAEEYKQQLESINVQLGIINAIASYFNKAGNLPSAIPSTVGLQDGTLSALIGKYNDTQDEYQRLLRTNQPGNPLVVNAKEQLNSLKQNIQENIRSIRTNLKINQDNLALNSSRFESRIKTAPVIEHGLQERDRDQNVKLALFQYLTQKREETALALSANVPDAQIIDAPGYGNEPSKPKKPLVLLYAFLLGAVIPVAVIYTRDFFNKKISYVEDVSQFTDLKILGELCHIKSKNELVIGGQHKNNITELFRYIRNNLNYNDNTNPNQVLLVTSSIQGEGKTFTSINLGATLANVHKRVVILEFDLRKPDLLKKMKISSKIGITDFINSEDVEIKDILIPSAISPNLFVIGSGTMYKDPGEELHKPRVEVLFEKLKKEFDYVIVDTSPIGLVADAFTLAPFTDGSVFVVRYNYTPKSHLNILDDIDKNNKLKNPMIILNDGKVDNLKNYVYGSTVYA